ncbi:MAG: riboflavin synthase [Planctomycetes bacterium]|nr:riboflavin synthase [Planctomycetota bacterium]
MFTGIIEGAPRVLRVQPQGTGMRIWVAAPDPQWAVVEGESVANCGCCLTVVELCEPRVLPGQPAPDPERGVGARLPEGTPGATMLFELSAETLARTHFGSLESGARVNVERSLRLGDRLSGHMVSGHVDGGATLVATRDSGDGGQLYTFEVDPGLERYLIEKGSVALDGISLTVVEPRGRRFDVALIPLTLEVTNLGEARVGQRFNVEADLVGKWIEKLVVAER